MVTRFFTLSLLVLFGVSSWAQDAAEATAETTASVYNDAIAALKGKEYEKALEMLEKSIEMADPEADAKVLDLAKKNSAIASYYVGNNLMKAGNMEEALSTYKKGIEYNEGQYTNYYGIAKVMDKTGTLMEAVDAYVMAGQKASDAGKADRAEQYVGKAANKIGRAYSGKKWNEVVEAGSKFLETNESADVNYYVAKACIEKKDGSTALAHAEKAVELGGETEEGKYLLAHAEALELSGNLPAAAAAYKKVPQGKYYDHAQYRAGQLQ